MLDNRSAFLRVLSLSMISYFAQAQRSFDSVEIFTVPFQTFATASTVPTSASSYPSLTQFSLPLRATDVVAAPAFIISNISDYNAYCWYPISGNYALFPRALFYATIVFALLGRTHEWLIAGALAAALTYSGCAAIHASVLVWSNRATGELDFFPLLVILSSSCLIAIPLINWSSTLRNLGRRTIAQSTTPTINVETYSMTTKAKDANAETRGPTVQAANADAKGGSSRSIIIYWALLVSVGCLACYVAVFNRYATAMSIYESKAESISCTPPNGFLDVSAGQRPGWSAFYMTQEFLDVNQCSNFCQSDEDSSDAAIMRDSGDLVALKASEIQRNFQETTASNIDRQENSIPYYFSWSAWFLLPYFICQGVWAALFPRLSPSEVRYELYKLLRKVLGCPINNDQSSSSSSSLPPRSKEAVARFVAFTAYLWALLILVICPPLFILNIIIGEMLISRFPTSEPLYHVGSWSPLASTVLVLIAAGIARFHRDLINHLKDIAGGAKDKVLAHLRRVFGKYQQVQHDSSTSSSPASPVSIFLKRIKIHSTKVILAPQEYAVDSFHDARKTAKRELRRIRLAWTEPALDPQKMDPLQLPKTISNTKVQGRDHSGYHLESRMQPDQSREGTPFLRYSPPVQEIQVAPSSLPETPMQPVSAIPQPAASAETLVPKTEDLGINLPEASATSVNDNTATANLSSQLRSSTNERSLQGPIHLLEGRDDSESLNQPSTEPHSQV